MLVRSSHASNEQNDKGLWYSGGPFTPDSATAADEIDKFLISILTRQMQPLQGLAAPNPAIST